MSWFGFMTLEGATVIVLLMCLLDLIKYILCITFNDATTCAPEMEYETIDRPPLNNFEAIICPAEPICPAGTICLSEPICPPEPMCLSEPECPSDPSLPPEFKSPMETILAITTLTQGCLPEPKSEGTKHPVEANCETIKDAPESIYQTESIGSAGTIYPSEPICPPEPVCLRDPECPSDPSHPPEIKGPIETTLEIPTLTQGCLPEPKSEGTKHSVEANCETIKDATESIYPTESIGSAGTICPSEPICPPEPVCLREPECPSDPSHPPEINGPIETTLKIPTLTQDCLPEPQSEGTKQPVEANYETIKDAPEPNDEVKDITQSTEPITEGHKSEGPYIALSFAPESYCASEAAWKITTLSPECLSNQKSEGTTHPAQTNLDKIEDGPEPIGEAMNLAQLKQPLMEVTVDSVVSTWAPKPNCA